MGQGWTWERQRGRGVQPCQRREFLSEKKSHSSKASLRVSASIIIQIQHAHQPRWCTVAHGAQTRAHTQRLECAVCRSGCSRASTASVVEMHPQQEGLLLVQSLKTHKHVHTLLHARRIFRRLVPLLFTPVLRFTSQELNCQWRRVGKCFIQSVYLWIAHVSSHCYDVMSQ